jgi:hypothetical protein
MKNKKGNPIIVGIFVLALVLFIIFVGFAFKLSGNSIFGENHRNDQFIEEISLLTPLTFDSVNSLEQYQEFADGTNVMLNLFEDKFNLKIERLDSTQKGWDKLSKVITKCGPLLGNYNNIIYFSKKHEAEHTKESYSDAYVGIRSFAFEFAILSATSTHQLTFKTIGKVFGRLGIGKVALKCPTCARTIMSGAYWSLKSYVVEESSGLIDQIADFADEKLKIDILELNK